MKFLNTLLMFSILGIAFLVSGCGATQSLAPTRSVTTATYTQTASNKTIWIEYAQYTASQVHENPTYWVLTSKQVNHVGQFDGAIDDPSTESGWHSNGLSVGTKFFVIPGISPVKAFAVEVKNGVYVEALSAGNKKPSS